MPKIVTPVEHLPKLKVRKKVAAYVRVSSGKEAMIHSLAAQADYYSNLINMEHEWLFVGIYSDEAITGTKSERKGFQQMLEDCKDGKVDVIITKSISRFARNTVTLLETVRSLKLMGVDVFFEEQSKSQELCTLVLTQTRSADFGRIIYPFWASRSLLAQKIPPKNFQILFLF